MRSIYWLLVVLSLFVGCDRKTKTGSEAEKTPEATPGTATETPMEVAPATAPKPKVSLTEARSGFKTRLVKPIHSTDPLPKPPPGQFRLVHYNSPAGKLPAYLSVAPASSAKRPAIIWITGGDSNSIGDVWSPASVDDDQTASAYRKAGIIMMFPALRGGNGNAASQEKFYGEVDDILAAAEFLGAQEGVDRRRIYLGGHSTGGTLVLLVAECSNRFRAVFSFGPIADIRGYSEEMLPRPFDQGNPREFDLRSPGRWLNGIQSPTWVVEGSVKPTNSNELRAMAEATSSPTVRFRLVEGANHLSVLSGANELLARKILQDTGEECTISVTNKELCDAVVTPVSSSQR